eukprot:1727119-Ditylum_brightwellii.AAC.1
MPQSPVSSLTKTQNIISKQRQAKAERVADAYVNGTGNTYVNEEKQACETPDSIRDSLRHIAVTWEQLSFGSGGHLCPKKTFWWLIWWNWKDGKETMYMKDNLDMNINLKFGRDQSETTIKRRNCDEAVKDLGVLVSPKGDFSPEFLR